MSTLSGNDQRIPITLLTGFLGAGKTTLVNRILSDPISARTAIIVNEFGEVGIDGALITRASEDMLELSNGCVCCSSKDDLIQALYKLYMRKVGLMEPSIAFDRVLIETTGLANPLPLARAFYTDMSLSLSYRLDAIVTLIDIKHVASQVRDAPEAKRQIALADKIVLNKRDLANDDEYRGARALANALNPLALKKTVSFGNLKPQELFDIGLFDPNTQASAVGKWIGANAERPAAKDSGHCDVCAAEGHHHHAHHDQPDHANSSHDSDVCAVSFRDPGEMDHDKLMSFISRLTESYGSDLYRVKGLIRLSGVEKPIILQGVQNIFSPLVYADAWPSGVPETRLVIIGKGLMRAELAEQFIACISTGDLVFDRSLGLI